MTTYGQLDVKLYARRYSTRVKSVFFLFFFLTIGSWISFFSPVYAQTTNFSQSLTTGSTGAEVTSLQAFLIANGFLNITAPTGVFGRLTASAVAQWQASVGLPNTGYFGALSRAYLESIATGGAIASPPPATIPSIIADTFPASIFTRNLAIGDTGTDVSALQSLLIADGFLPADTVVGHFGSITEAAVAKWQATIGLPATGYFGMQSRSAIKNASLNANTNINTSTSANSSDPLQTPATPPVVTTDPAPAAVAATPTTDITADVSLAYNGRGGGGGNPPPSDTTSPTVSIISPSVNSTVDGTISVIVNATDNVGVTKVVLYVDGTPQASLANVPYSFSLNTSVLSSGPHTLGVKAYDAAGNVGIGATITVVVVPLTPSVPTNLTLTGVTASNITLTWFPSTEFGGRIAGYKIYNGANTQIGTTLFATYLNTGLSANTTYSYSVAAFDAVGNVSARSAIATTKTATTSPPTDTTPPTISITSPLSNSTIAGTISVAVSVSDNVGITKVELYVDNLLKNTIATGPYSFSLNANTMSTGSHVLGAKAYDAAGNIGTAANVTVVVTPLTPTVPNNLTVTGVTTSSIALSWSPSTEFGGTVAGYKLFQGSTQIATSSITSFNNTGLSLSTTYHYSVESYDVTGSVSAPSTVVATTTLALPVVATTTPPLNYNYGLAVSENLFGLSNTALNADLDDIASLGIGWIRFDIQWDHVQSNNSTNYNWAYIDQLVAAANAHHIKMLPILDYTPTWAEDPSCAQEFNSDRCPPANAAQYATFVTAAVTRYAPQGISAWEIWNEPNLVQSWEPAADPAGYATILKAAYTAIKTVQPSATVVTGGLGPTDTSDGAISPTDFLTALYADGAKGYFDAVGDHPYSYPAMPLYNQFWNAWSQITSVNPSMESIMSANGDVGKKIWLTEYGAPTGGPGVLESNANDTVFAGNPDHVTEALQAQMLSQAITAVQGVSWAGPLFIYTYKDLGTDQSTVENFFGIIHSDGSTKPTYTTIKSMNL